MFPRDQVPAPLEVLELADALEPLAGRAVDVLVLNDASPIIAFQAVKHGQRVFCRDLAAYHAHVVRLITEYADFKIIRRPIEEAVLKRRIYGR